MNIEKLNNAVQVKNIDLQNDSECIELGKLVVDECVVFIDDSVTEKRLCDIQLLWGSSFRTFIHEAVSDGKLKGKHWNNLFLSLTRVSQDTRQYDVGMTRVSYEKNKKGKPTGIFTNGELDWHSDGQSQNYKQRVIGLMSLWNSENSQTWFLNTAPVYDSLNHEDKTMVDELFSVWKWDGGKMSEDLIESQMEIVRTNMCAVDYSETPLLGVTATGKKGIHFPSHCFSHFRGMTVEDSLKFKEHLWNKMNKDEYIYKQQWKDGQIVFMDQNITLHCRPTNIKDGDKRTMCRMITTVDKIFPDEPKMNLYYKENIIEQEKYLELADQQKLFDYKNKVSLRSVNQLTL